MHRNKGKKFITHQFLKNQKKSDLQRMVPSVGEVPGLVIFIKQAKAVSETKFLGKLLAFHRCLGYDRTFSGINCAKT